jgi:protein-disulfide isomerase
MRLKFIGQSLLGIAFAFGVVLGSPAWAQSSGGTSLDPTALEKIIRDTILKNPEIVVEALEAYKRQEVAREAAAAEAAVSANREKIQRDPGSPVGGNPKGDVTLVEFFDYRCGVCKRVHPTVAALIKSDGKIRRVYKEWPILGPQSVFASRAALASREQGLYLPFHNALMEVRGALTAKRVMAAASKVGLDTKKLAIDMKDARIDLIFERNFKLARALRINGTPSFVIGDTLIKGARDIDTMRALVVDARTKGK